MARLPRSGHRQLSRHQSRRFSDPEVDGVYKQKQNIYSLKTVFLAGRHRLDVHNNHMIDQHSKSLTQGSIFSHAMASNFNADVFGLVITARCDLTHGKISLVNYVPLIPLKDWIKVYANGIAVERLIKAETASARRRLSELGESDELIDYFSSNDIETHLHAHSGIRKNKKNFENLVKNLRQRNELITYKTANGFDEKYRKDFNRIVVELCEHKVAEHHFFSSIKPDKSGKAYVALLREIRFIPSVIAEKICSGFDAGEYNEIVSHHNCAPDSLSMVGEDCFCESVGTVRSPEIEFIMQRATILFSRIGVDDTPNETIELLKSVKIGDDF